MDEFTETKIEIVFDYRRMVHVFRICHNLESRNVPSFWGSDYLRRELISYFTDKKSFSLLWEYVLRILNLRKKKIPIENAGIFRVSIYNLCMGPD